MPAFRPRSPRPDPTASFVARGPGRLARRSSSRTSCRPTGLALLLTAAAAAVGAAATPAGADVARISASPDRPGGGVDVTVAVTATDGARRALGPFALPDGPSGVLASPDGRHLLLLPGVNATEGPDREEPPHVVATDGGPAVALAVPPGAWFTQPLETFSWSADGTEVVASEVAVGSVRGRTGRPAVLRCPIASGTCAVVPGATGVAAGLSGGTVVSASSAFSLLPAEYLFRYEPLGAPASPWLRRSSRRGRLSLAVACTRRTSVVRWAGPGPRDLARTTRAPVDGLPVASAAVAGPAGALVLGSTFRPRLGLRRDRVRLRSRYDSPTLTTVLPDGTSRSRRPPVLTVPRRNARHASGVPRRGALRAAFVPTQGRPEGGWLGTAGGIALATMAPDGRARLVEVGGRTATAETLLRGVPGGGRVRAAADLTVLAYEASARSALVAVDWARSRRAQALRRTVLRVPLDGSGAPAVLPAGTETAW